MGNRITQEDIEKMERLCKEGANIMQIAEKTRRCRSTVQRILKERGYTIGLPVVKCKENYKVPLRPEEIRRFRDNLKPGDMVYMQEDGVVQRYKVIEKYTYFVRVETSGSRRRTRKTSASYVELIISGRSGENGSR